jgi:hypothetical protein
MLSSVITTLIEVSPRSSSCTTTDAAPSITYFHPTRARRLQQGGSGRGRCCCNAACDFQCCCPSAVSRRLHIFCAGCSVMDGSSFRCHCCCFFFFFFFFLFFLFCCICCRRRHRWFTLYFYYPLPAQHLAVISKDCQSCWSLRKKRMKQQLEEEGL